MLMACPRLSWAAFILCFYSIISARSPAPAARGGTCPGHHFILITPVCLAKVDSCCRMIRKLLPVVKIGFGSFECGPAESTPHPPGVGGATDPASRRHGSTGTDKLTVCDTVDVTA